MKIEPHVVAQQEVEAGRLQIWSQPGLYSEFSNSIGNKETMSENTTKHSNTKEHILGSSSFLVLRQSL